MQKMKQHKKHDQFRDAIIGLRLPIELDKLLSRVAGRNKSAFIRTAIQHYILTAEEDAEIFLSGMKPA